LLSTAQINCALIPPLRASERNQLVAVASRSMEQAESYAREWDIPRVHGSYEALLADPEVDVIYNPLPNHMHAASVGRSPIGTSPACNPLCMSMAQSTSVQL
jgi:predicted dehydrogenase